MIRMTLGADLELKFGCRSSYAKWSVNLRHCCSTWSSCFVDNSGQFVPIFYLSIKENIKRLGLLWYFFVLFTALMWSDSIFNLLKRVTDGSFLFLWEMLAFLFLPFLNLVIQIWCLQNQYTSLKSALDQSLFVTHM